MYISGREVLYMETVLTRQFLTLPTEAVLLRAVLYIASDLDFRVTTSMPYYIVFCPRLRGCVDI